MPWGLIGIRKDMKVVSSHCYERPHPYLVDGMDSREIGLIYGFTETEDVTHLFKALKTLLKEDE